MLCAMLVATLTIFLAGTGSDCRAASELTPSVVVVESRSYLLDFVPFGVGQLQQGRTRAGLLFASTELILGATSVAAYLAIDGLVRQSTFTGDPRLTTLTVRAIPAGRMGEANALSAVKLVSGIAFYALCALGIIDAVFHDDDTAVTASASGLNVRF